MDDLRQDSKTDLPTEYFALCSDHFEASFQQKLLIGTPVDFKRFEKRSVPTIDAKGKDSLDNDYPRNEGRLANLLWKFLWDPTGIQNPPPPQKKKKKK